MKQITDDGVVEVKSGVACIVCNASNIMPFADGQNLAFRSESILRNLKSNPSTLNPEAGSSRDLPGHEKDVDALERLLPTLGFKILPT